MYTGHIDSAQTEGLKTHALHAGLPHVATQLSLDGSGEQSMCTEGQQQVAVEEQTRAQGGSPCNYITQRCIARFDAFESWLSSPQQQSTVQPIVHSLSIPVFRTAAAENQH